MVHRTPRRIADTVLAALLAVGAAAVVAQPPAGAAWTVQLASGTARPGKAASTILAAPTGATASCGVLGLLEIKLTWNAVARASTYRVWRSTTETGTYTVVTSGVTTTSWTSSTLAIGKYYFEVSATPAAGIRWVGPRSAPSNAVTIITLLCSATP